MGVGDGAVRPCELRVLWTFKGAGSSLDTVDSESWRCRPVRDRSIALDELLADRGEKLPGALGGGLSDCMGVGASGEGAYHILTGPDSGVVRVGTLACSAGHGHAGTMIEDSRVRRFEDSVGIGEVENGSKLGRLVRRCRKEWRWLCRV